MPLMSEYLRGEVPIKRPLNNKRTDRIMNEIRQVFDED